MPDEEKLEALYTLKSNAESCHLTGDSSYVLLLRSIGHYEYLAHNDYQLAVAFASQAVNLNKALKLRRSQHLSPLCYFSIGYYYQNAKLYRLALTYYDSTVASCENAADIQPLRVPARQNKAYICFFLGDYEKSVEECKLGMQDALLANDSLQYLIFLNIRAQSLCFANNLPQAEGDARLAIQMAETLKDSFELAAAYKTSGAIAERKKESVKAKDFYLKTIDIRKHTGDAAAIASDYNDLGAFFLNSANNYTEAKKNLLNTIAYAQQIGDSIQRSSQLALAYSNLGETSFKNNKLPEAIQYYSTAFRYLNLPVADYLLTNPPAAQLRIVEHKELVYNLLMQKTALLLQLYHQHRHTSYLAACLQTAHPYR